jgi:hypothetical protein
MTIYHRMSQCIKPGSHNKTYELDKQLHTIESNIYHCIIVRVAGLDGETRFQICR